MQDIIPPKISETKKSLLQTVGEGSAISFFGNLALKFGTIASSIILLRYISVSDYGLWQILLSVVGFATLFTLPSLETLLIADLSSELGRKREDIYKAIFKQSSLLIFVLGAIGGVGLFFAAPLISYITGLEITLLLRILSASFILNPLQRSYFLAFYSHLRYGLVHGTKIVHRGGYIILLVFFVLWLDMGITGIVLAHTLSVLFSLLFFFPFFLKICVSLKNIPQDIHYSLWRTFRTHGKWALVGDYFDDIAGSVRPWILGYFLGLEGLAVVTVAMNLYGEMVTVIPLNQILGPLIPREMEERKERMPFILERSIKYLFWFYAAAGVTAFFAAPPLVAVIFPQYVASMPLFRVLLPTLLILPFSMVFYYTFYALKAQKSLFLASSGVKLTFSFFALPLFVWIFRAHGVAVELISHSLTLAYARYAFLKKIYPEFMLRPRHLFLWDSDDRMLMKRVFYSLYKRQ
jgi:O-antigen/teichoic acid export membrane protein